MPHVTSPLVHKALTILQPLHQPDIGRHWGCHKLSHGDSFSVLSFWQVNLVWSPWSRCLMVFLPWSCNFCLTFISCYTISMNLIDLRDVADFFWFLGEFLARITFSFQISWISWNCIKHPEVTQWLSWICPKSLQHPIHTTPNHPDWLPFNTLPLWREHILKDLALPGSARNMISKLRMDAWNQLVCPIMTNLVTITISVEAHWSSICLLIATLFCAPSFFFEQKVKEFCHMGRWKASTRSTRWT